MTTPDIHTGRLHIRAPREEDLPALVDLWTDPEVTRFMGGPREAVWLEEALREDLGPEAPPYNLWPVELVATARIVGHCGILDKDVDGRAEYELVYVLARDVWGRGLATEAATALRDYAFAALGLDRLVSLIEPGNAASERVARKVGMVLEKETLRPGGKVMRVYANLPQVTGISERRVAVGGSAARDRLIIPAGEQCPHCRSLAYPHA